MEKRREKWKSKIGKERKEAKKERPIENKCVFQQHRTDEGKLGRVYNLENCRSFVF